MSAYTPAWSKRRGAGQSVRDSTVSAGQPLCLRGTKGACGWHLTCAVRAIDQLLEDDGVAGSGVLGVRGRHLVGQEQMGAREHRRRDLGR